MKVINDNKCGNVMRITKTDNVGLYKISAVKRHSQLEAKSYTYTPDGREYAEQPSSSDLCSLYKYQDVVEPTEPTERTFTEAEIRNIYEIRGWAGCDKFLDDIITTQDATKKRREADYVEYLRLKQIFEKE